MAACEIYFNIYKNVVCANSDMYSNSSQPSVFQDDMA